MLFQEPWQHYICTCCTAKQIIQMRRQTDPRFQCGFFKSTADDYSPLLYYKITQSVCHIVSHAETGQRSTGLCGVCWPVVPLSSTMDESPRICSIGSRTLYIKWVWMWTFNGHRNSEGGSQTSSTQTLTFSKVVQRSSEFRKCIMDSCHGRSNSEDASSIRCSDNQMSSGTRLDSEDVSQKSWNGRPDPEDVSKTLYAVQHNEWERLHVIHVSVRLLSQHM